MKLNLTLTGLMLGALMAGCTSATAATYQVDITLPDNENGQKAYITDYDTGAKIDSTIVEGSHALFTGEIDTPVLARIIVGGNRASQLILEPGNIVATTGGFSKGTPLNDRLSRAIQKKIDLENEFRNLPQTPEFDARANEIIAEYDALPAKVTAENTDNPVGYFFFLQQAYDWKLAQLRQELQKYPQWAGTNKVKNLERALIIEDETSEGHPYKDFTIEYNGEKYNLSDYVGKNGNYTLVDFWASWCGPCMKELTTIRDLYDKYHGKGLDVVGVAVWDEPANSVETINSRQLPWPQILNAQKIPTDLYGISGIPCVILIDPSGNIVSRGKQGDALRADVDAALSTWTPEEE